MFFMFVVRMQPLIFLTRSEYLMECFSILKPKLSFPN